MPLRHFHSFLLILSLLAAIPLSAGPAFAQTLDQLRASGAVGERFDGFLELRDPGAAGAKSTVPEVNAKRRQIYAERAAREAATVEQVGQIYAKQILQQAPAGTWFLKPDGTWMQK